jgi:hypothetical protein
LMPLEKRREVRGCARNAVPLDTTPHGAASAESPLARG